MLSSGSTLVNLACSGKIDGAFPIGTYTHFLGGSRSGKTMISHNTLAEAAVNDYFKNYRLIYDNVEKGALMDLEKFWGPKLAARIEPPSRDKNKNPVYSKTILDFYHLLDDAKEDGRPFIWIEDSMASLDTNEEQNRFQNNKDLARKGKDLEGTYGMEKAKANSNNLRWVVDLLENTGSILIIINQTRDAIGFGAQFNPNTWAGGRALKFYAHLELHSQTIGEITQTVHGKPRQMGTTCQVKVKKNRINGRDRTVEVPIYHSIGVDDIGSMVDFLLDEKHWTKEKKPMGAGKEKEGGIQAPEFDFIGSREKLVAKIEEANDENDLKTLVQKVWDEIETACEIVRKPRYT